MGLRVQLGHVPRLSTNIMWLGSPAVRGSAISGTIRERARPHLHYISLS